MSGSTVKRAYFEDTPVALVVGCGDMGMGSARALGRRHPLIMLDIDRRRVDASVEALRHEGYTATGHVCDITDRDALREVSALLAASPGIKVLCHVAAIGNNGAGWRKIIEVDLVAARMVADEFGPLMVRGGVAIFVSSAGAKRCPRDARLDALIDDPLRPDLQERIIELLGREPNFLEAYFMSKRGMNRMAEQLAQEWGEREVRALSVSPGLIDSTMGRTSGKQVAITDDNGERRLGTRDEMAAFEVPLRRQGTVIEVINVIDFLASDAASFVNGFDVLVDGGGSASLRMKGVVPPALGQEQLAPPEPPAT